MILDDAMYRKALRVLGTLESKAKAGEATDAERERVETIRDHVLVWEWAHDSRPAVEVIPAPPAPVLPRSENPMVRRFADWWSRNRDRDRWPVYGWSVGMRYWWAKRGEELTDGLEGEVAMEMAARDLLEPEVIVTDLAAWFHAEREEAA